MAGIARPVAPVVRDVPIIAERVVEGAAIESEGLRLRLSHGVQQLEASHISIALRGHERDLRIQQFLLRVEDVENGPRSDALLGAGAL